MEPWPVIFSFSVLSSNTITPSPPSATASLLLARFIQPDMLDLDKSRQSTTTLLYWHETDGPVNFSGVPAPGVRVTVKAKMLRDLNIWAPTFSIVGNDA